MIFFNIRDTSLITKYVLNIYLVLYPIFCVFESPATLAGHLHVIYEYVSSY